MALTAGLVTAAAAAATPDEAPTTRRFIDRLFTDGQYTLMEGYADAYGDIFDVDRDNRVFYEELYTHYDSDGEIDWVLVRARRGDNFNADEPRARVGNTLLMKSGSEPLFCLGLGLYDVKLDKWFSVDNIRAGSDADLFDYRRYDGFIEGLDSVVPRLKDYGIKAGFLGDSDGDGRVTVFDVATIQRYLAQYIGSDRGDNFDMLADFDGDGKVTIFDCTAIQRYLADMPTEWYVSLQE